ncbi:DUF5331 domain-containing protein [Nostoc sp.]|uniref:DUF5331 domain-containing protein n=1 Tax=Nostoc sp. TaxID=1180 RepID=UPI002FF74438
MNIQHLRQSLKQNWLIYYQQNIPWLVKMRIWSTYDGLRRPLSGFILATLAVLEPQFDEILSFMLDLNNDPDKIVAALGLNFNPDEELRLIKSAHSMPTSQVESESPYQNHSENKDMSSVVAGCKIAPYSPAKTLDSNLPRADELVRSFTDIAEVVCTREPEWVVLFDTKIAPDTPVETPSSGFVSEYQPPQSSSLQQLPSGTLLTMTTEANSKAKTMPSVALATKISSNSKTVRSGFAASRETSPSVRMPVGALVAITTEISSNGKPVRSLAITTEVKNNSKHPNIQPQEVKSKVNLPTTNARSLASWVDEFCYGARDKKENIFL